MDSKVSTVVRQAPQHTFKTRQLLDCVCEPSMLFVQLQHQALNGLCLITPRNNVDKGKLPKTDVFAALKIHKIWDIKLLLHIDRVNISDLKVGSLEV